MHSFGILQHDDHLFRTLGESAFYRLRYMNLMTPLLSADRIAVQRIHNRVAARFFPGVTWRQKHEHFAVNAVAL